MNPSLFALLALHSYALPKNLTKKIAATSLGAVLFSVSSITGMNTWKSLSKVPKNRDSEAALVASTKQGDLDSQLLLMLNTPAKELSYLFGSKNKFVGKEKETGFQVVLRMVEQLNDRSSTQEERQLASDVLLKVISNVPGIHVALANHIVSSDELLAVDQFIEIYSKLPAGKEKDKVFSFICELYLQNELKSDRPINSITNVIDIIKGASEMKILTSAVTETLLLQLYDPTYNMNDLYNLLKSKPALDQMRGFQRAPASIQRSLKVYAAMAKVQSKIKEKFIDFVVLETKFYQANDKDFKDIAILFGWDSVEIKEIRELRKKGELKKYLKKLVEKKKKE